MPMAVPAYLPYYALAGSIVIIAAVLLALQRTLAEAAWPARQRTAAILTTGIVLGAWLAMTAVLAWRGAYRGAPEAVPTIQFGIALPIVAGLVAYWRIPGVARLLEAVPQQWLVGLQVYRVLGGIFVVLFAAGNLPGLFALPAGLGDLAVGLLAPLVALAYARKRQDSANQVLAWNVLGLADLAVALATGFITSPSPLQLAAFDSPNHLIAAFPLVLIPVFLVPLSILLHLASLAKLRQARRQGSQPPLGNAAPA